MIVREVRDDEATDSERLTSQAFFFGDRRFMRKGAGSGPQPLDRTTFGVWDDCGLQAKAVVIDFEQVFGERSLCRMGGIADVVCLPASRGKGYARAALQRALEHMREVGQPVSILFPFAYRYYRRLGWEWVGRRRTYTMPAGHFRLVPETEHVRLAGEDDRPAIQRAYAQYATRYRGMLVRGAQLWQQRLDDSDDTFTYTYRYPQSGPVEGYVTWKGGEGSRIRVGEFIALNLQAKRALLGLMRRHNMQTDSFRWHAAEDDALWMTDFEIGIDTSLEPLAMGRVVDVAGAFGCWKPLTDAEGAADVQITDDVCPWNNACWRVELSGGAVTAVPTNADPQVSLDIRALSQAFYGSPSLMELRNAGLVHVSEQTSWETLERALAGPPMNIHDSF
ncbi:MAG: GNAT family N-acetyltransferase [Armatimonadetes bacterium]|nr:GNAT family N-acetyltransferase [Armatimonadota bacterium]MDE2205209.1 GNAT family N-acetyltransferase [Armatimonadota bacterium]